MQCYFYGFLAFNICVPLIKMHLRPQVVLNQNFIQVCRTFAAAVISVPGCQNCVLIKSIFFWLDFCWQDIGYTCAYERAFIYSCLVLFKHPELLTMEGVLFLLCIYCLKKKFLV